MLSFLVCLLHADDLSGFYFGANVGANSTSDKNSYNDHDLNPNALLSGNGNAHNSRTSVGGFAGYNYVVQRVVLGAELAVDHFFKRPESAVFNNHFMQKMWGAKTDYGFLLRAGLRFNACTFAYLGAGLKRQEYNYNIIDVENGTVTNVLASVSKKKLVPQIELGIEGMFNKNIGWRTAYSYLLRKSVDVKTFPAGHPLTKGRYPSAGYSSRRQTVKFGVFYRF